MTGNFLKSFVKIPICTCFFENFGKNRFTIDNRVFRVFVEIPIGKILALFDVFPATLKEGGGLGLDYGKNDWKKWHFDSSTIDNVIFKFFNKKSHFIKKVNFSIDNDLQYFPPKIHFLYWKNGFQKILEVKKKFSQQHEPLSSWPPPIVLLRKRQKVPKFDLWVFCQKLEKHDYQSWNSFYQNFRKNTYLSGFWRKFSKICRSFKG